MFDYEYIKKENKCVLGSAIKMKIMASASEVQSQGKH